MHLKRNDMSMQNTLFNVVVNDNITGSQMPTLISASTPQEASDRACLTYVQAHMPPGSLAMVRRLIANGTLSAEVTEIGGNSDDDSGNVISGPVHPFNWLLAGIAWAVIVAVLYWYGFFDWLTPTNG